MGPRPARPGGVSIRGMLTGPAEVVPLNRYGGGRRERPRRRASPGARTEPIVRYRNGRDHAQADQGPSRKSRAARPVDPRRTGPHGLHRPLAPAAGADPRRSRGRLRPGDRMGDGHGLLPAGRSAAGRLQAAPDGRRPDDGDRLPARCAHVATSRSARRWWRSTRAPSSWTW